MQQKVKFGRIFRNHKKASSRVKIQPAIPIVANMSQQDIVYNISDGIIEPDSPYSPNLYQIYHIITKNPLSIRISKMSLERGTKNTCNDYLTISYDGYERKVFRKK